MLKEKTTLSERASEKDLAILREQLHGLGYPRLQDRSLRAALGHAVLKSFGAGQVVIREGDAPEQAYIVHKGTLRIETRAAGVVAEVGPGDIVGEVGLLIMGPRTATVRTTRGCELFVLESEAFERLLRSSPEFRRRMERLALARRPRAGTGA